MPNPRKTDLDRMFTWLTGLLLAGLVAAFIAPALFVMSQTVDFSSGTSSFFRQDGELADSVVLGAANEEIVDGKDVATGLLADQHYQLVKANCTNCHSAQLITQNRATREGWESMIRWMQRTQKLWDLGENEVLILDYLSKNYAPEATGRRKNLEEIDWYVLSEE